MIAIPALTAEAEPWIAAALDWWRDAGVDHAYADEPQGWLAEPAEPASPEAAPSDPSDRRAATAPARAGRAAPLPATDEPPFGGDPAGWPQTLPDFAPWWLSEPALGGSPVARRVSPSGPAQAALMVLVAMPEADDGEALLAGREGRLLDAMLAAFGLSRAQCYIASALPAHQPMPDWQALKAAGIGQVIAHHVALAAPQRLLVLGRSDVSSLVNHDPAKMTAHLPGINHGGPEIPVRFGYGLSAMLARPPLKRSAWADWLEWTGKGPQ